MEKQKKKSNVPLIPIVIGFVLILGALLALVLRQPGSQESSPKISQLSDTSEIARVQPDEAKAAYDSGEAIFVDVRPRETFTESHIPGALSIPLDEIQDRLDELDPKNWIILY
jgi:hypothetical protein